MLKLADLAKRADFSLGSLRVSPARRRIEGPAGEMHVEPLIMQVFVLLVEAKSEVVTRTRLFDECWGGVNVGDYSLNRAITMVRRIAAEVAPGAFEIENIPRTGYRLLAKGSLRQDVLPATREWRRRVLIAAILASVLAAAALAWLLAGRGQREPTAAIVAGDGPSADLATGIASATITTAATYQAPIRLLEHPGAGSNFILRVRKAPGGDGERVDLSLVSGPDKALLWSWSATRPQGQQGTLDQLAREAGAAVLVCAAETRAAGSPPDQGTVKLYLDACARFDVWHGAELSLLADSFERVTAKAPRLEGAWAKLFLSKAEGIEGYPAVDFVDSLRRDIRSAQANGIDIAESYIATAAVLPLNARFERLQLYETGLARYPRSPFLHAARSWQLRSVGRMDEAARTAQRLVDLYPQSSAAKTEYVNSLMYSGRPETARNVLNRALRSSPHATNLQWARWRLEMRYGDPKVALSMARAGDRVVSGATINFLRARINPSKANVDRAIADLMANYREDPWDPGAVAQALGMFGRTEDAVQFLLHHPLGARSGDAAESLFRPHLREVRRDPRFMLIVRNFGVTDYWLKSGMLPDFCFEQDLPYDCRKALAEMRRT